MMTIIRRYFMCLPQAAFDHSYSVGILRVKSGLDFSTEINAVETETETEAEEVEGEFSLLV